jgi:hypothetical protein
MRIIFKKRINFSGNIFTPPPTAMGDLYELLPRPSSLEYLTLVYSFRI